MQLLLAVLLLAQAPAPSPGSRLFLDQAPLALTIETDLRALFRDRGEHKKDHPATLRFGTAPDTGSLGVQLRTRGIFRLARCAFPPIRVDLPKHKVDATPFAGRDKIKLVTHCQSSQSFERNLLREYALYRVFNAITDTSFRVRLAHVTYLDSAQHDTVTRYAFLIEPDRELAARLGGEVLETANVHDLITDPSYMTLVSVFQYLIGNTDWSVWGRHNIAIVSMKAEPHTLFALPYDFDYSGAVGAPYAIPPQTLPIHSVHERLYRGYCQPDTIVTAVLARFRAAKDSMYAAVRAVPDLSDKDVRGLLDYFDDFYKAIDNRAVVQRDFMRACRRLPQ
jgi:hypothetical protein